jgi:tRNA-2-methylthio-N6-dimethylallyladenosine synthase
MTYCLLHLGCQMNQSDAERVRAVIEGMGYERTDDETAADVLGLVACSVRQKAIDKVYARISTWNAWKGHRSLLTFATGCILPADREKFLTLFDLVFDITELPQLPDMIAQYGVPTAGSAGQRPVAGAGVDPAVPAAVSPGHGTASPVMGLSDPSLGFWRIGPRYSSGFDAYIPIQNGCDKYCTFCAVPYTRGREVSRPSAEILAEVSDLVGKGFRSLTLLGQNVNSYGQDRRGAECSFSRLLESVGEIGDSSGREVRVYFTSPHPCDMTTDVLEVMARHPSLAKQVHLPLQSGDDKVLVRMNRNYQVAEYRERVAEIRALLPTATLFTDIIVGFSGEGEEQFENTRRAMREFRYNMAYVAMYSPRPGAASSHWVDDVPHEEKNRRLHVLSEELQRTSGEYTAAMVGRTWRVLVEGADRKKGFLAGRTEGRIPVRFASTDTALVGTFVDVTVTSAAPLSVEGTLAPAQPAERAPAGSAASAR